MHILGPRTSIDLCTNLELLWIFDRVFSDSYYIWIQRTNMTWNYVGLNWVKALHCPRLAGPDWSRRLLGCLQYGCFVSVFMGKTPRKPIVPIASNWESIEMEICNLLPNDLDLAQVLSLQSRSRDTGSSKQCSTFWRWRRCIMQVCAFGDIPFSTPLP